MCLFRLGPPLLCDLPHAFDCRFNCFSSSVADRFYFESVLLGGWIFSLAESISQTPVSVTGRPGTNLQPPLTLISIALRIHAGGVEMKTTSRFGRLCGCPSPR